MVQTQVKTNTKKRKSKRSSLEVLLKQECGLDYYLTEKMPQSQQQRILELYREDEAVTTLIENLVNAKRRVSNNNRRLGSERESIRRKWEKSEQDNQYLQTEMSQLKSAYDSLFNRLVKLTSVQLENSEIVQAWLALGEQLKKWRN